MTKEHNVGGEWRQKLSPPFYSGETVYEHLFIDSDRRRRFGQSTNHPFHRPQANQGHRLVVVVGS